MASKNKGTLKKILIWITSILGAIILCVALFFGWLTIVEYRPDDIENVEIIGNDINDTIAQDS
nr:hypothetical protein [Lachnospiraceae bacterium]